MKVLAFALSLVIGLPLAADPCPPTTEPNLSRAVKASCEIAQVAGKCQKLFGDHPEWNKYKNDCSQSTVFETSANWFLGCGAGVVENVFGFLNAKSDVADAEFSVARKAELAQEAYFTCKGEYPCCKDEQTDADRSACLAKALGDVTAHDLFAKRDSLRALARRDPKTMAFMKAKGVPRIDVDDSPKPIPLAALLKKAVELAALQVKETKTELQCFNGAGRLKLLCAGVMDAITLVSGGVGVVGKGLEIFSELRGEAWVDRVLRSNGAALRTTDAVSQSKSVTPKSYGIKPKSISEGQDQALNYGGDQKTFLGSEGSKSGDFERNQLRREINVEFRRSQNPEERWHPHDSEWRLSWVKIKQKQIAELERRKKDGEFISDDELRKANYEAGEAIMDYAYSKTAVDKNLGIIIKRPKSLHLLNTDVDFKPPEVKVKSGPDGLVIDPSTGLVMKSPEGRKIASDIDQIRVYTNGPLEKPKNHGREGWETSYAYEARAQANDEYNRVHPNVPYRPISTHGAFEYFNVEEIRKLDFTDGDYLGYLPNGGVAPIRTLDDFKAYNSYMRSRGYRTTLDE